MSADRKLFEFRLSFLNVTKHFINTTILLFNYTMSRWKARIVSDAAEPKAEDAVRLLCLSDTHGQHDKIPTSSLSECDIVLFAGDCSEFGSPDHVSSFKKWLHSLPGQKVMIAGNQDLTFENSRLTEFSILRPNLRSTEAAESKASFLSDLDGVTYLEESSTVVHGIKIFGSPYTPEFFNLAFQIRLWDAKKRWSAIPDDADIVLTHGPPRGICDTTSTGFSCGCPELKSAVDRIQPSLCVFGHIHEAHGASTVGQTLYCNVAVADPPHLPTLIDMEPANR